MSFFAHAKGWRVVNVEYRAHPERNPDGTLAGVQPSGAGHGLVGMRERVSSVSGRLVAVRDRDRFVVRACLPVVRAPAPAGAGP